MFCYKKIEGVDQIEKFSKVMIYGNFGWEYYELGDVDKVIEYSIKVLELLFDLVYVKLNMGLFYLIKGDEVKVNDFYIDVIMIMKSDCILGKGYLKVVIDDIENVVKRYLDLKGYKLIFGELKNEYVLW